MLETLSIRNFVIVDALDIDLRAGFTALTGETGAGKSILLDALQMILGVRTDSGVIRQGCQKAEASAIFTAGAARGWLSEKGFPADSDSVLLRRTIDTGGRSRGWINGSPATMAQLREIAALLVDIHGQNEHQSLARADAQLELLDAAAGLEPQRAEVSALHRAWRAARQKLDLAKAASQSARDNEERLAWIVEELRQLGPKPGEYELVEARHARMSNAVEIAEDLAAALEALSGEAQSATDLAGQAESRLAHALQWDPRIGQFAEELAQARSLLQDCSRDIEQYLESNQYDEEAFRKLDARLSDYFSAGKKFRRRPEDLAAHLQECEERLAQSRASQDLEQLAAREKAASAAYTQAAHRLRGARLAAAKDLADRVTGAMQSLAMPGGAFGVALHESAPAATGIDRCEFLVAGHPGVPLRPLSKVASGGELARIGLALAVVGSQAALADTLVFDEIDTGIGGGVAEVVGRHLATLGQSRQVLCVTHLAQVASRAAHHLHVTKSQNAEGQTLSHLAELSGESRVQEIARMAGGIRITPATLAHAREMLGP